jgi:hypothetical protein
VAQPEHVPELVHRHPHVQRGWPAGDIGIEQHGDAAVTWSPDARREPQAAVAAARPQPLALRDEHDVGGRAGGGPGEVHASAGAVPAPRGGVDRLA